MVQFTKYRFKSINRCVSSIIQLVISHLFPNKIYIGILLEWSFYVSVMGYRWVSIQFPLRKIRRCSEGSLFNQTNFIDFPETTDTVRPSMICAQMYCQNSLTLSCSLSLFSGYICKYYVTYIMIRGMGMGDRLVNLHIRICSVASLQMFWLTVEFPSNRMSRLIDCYSAALLRREDSLVILRAFDCYPCELNNAATSRILVNPAEICIL